MLVDLEGFDLMFVHCVTSSVCFLVVALALCKYSLAELNTTEQPANNTVSLHHQGNTNNFKGRLFSPEKHKLMEG